MNDKVADLSSMRLVRRAGRRPGARGQRGCPICGNPVVEAFRPFCSRRCADIDLGRWLKEGYRVPSDEGPGEGEPGSGQDDD